jgi:hypothetical protein
MLYTEKPLFFGFEQVTELAGTSLPFHCLYLKDNNKMAHYNAIYHIYFHTNWVY